MKNQKKHTDDRKDFKRAAMSAVQYLFLLSFAITLAGCGTMPISNKDEMVAIKRIAVVSLSVNDRIYNAKAGPESDSDYAMLKKKQDDMREYTGKTKDTTPDSTKQILLNSSKTYTKALQRITHWELIPVEKVVAIPAYQQFTGEPVDEKDFISTMVFPDSKYFNPFRDNTYYKNENDKTQQALTELCQKLEVDAVVVLRTKLGYEPVGMQLLGGLGNLLASKKTKAKPTVGTGILVVTKAGKRAAFTVTEMKYQGPEVPMLMSGLADFTGDDAVVIKSYEQAIDASATALMDIITTEVAAK